MKNVFGGLSVLASTGLVGLALYWTKDITCLWGLILTIGLAYCFPWDEKNEK